MLELTYFKANYHTDPGHGWFEVPKSFIKVLGIEGCISSYSYEDQHNLYLEEDCDFGVLYEACKKMNVKLEWEEKHIDGHHWIRNLKPHIAPRNEVYDCV